MRFVQLSTARTIDVELDQRATATPTFRVLTPQGGESLAATAVAMDSVDTTLAGAATAGAVTVSVTLATGIVVGRKYLLAGAESAGGERVTVKAINGTTITLVRPLRIAKAILATFQSTRLSCAITAAAVATIARHYRIEVTYLVSTVAQPAAVFPFDVVRVVPTTTLATDDIADLDPIFAKRIAAGVWMPALIERTWEMVCRRLAARVDPGAILGSRDFTTPHSYLTREVVLEGAGADYEPMRQLMAKRFLEEFDAACAETPVDNNQDAVVAPNEGAWNMIQLDRG